MSALEVGLLEGGLFIGRPFSTIGPLGKKFQFDVGSSEEHHLEISVGGFSTTGLLVDGKAVQDQETERASQTL